MPCGLRISGTSRKLEKLVQSDFAPQASISDVLMNAGLVAGAARQSRVSAPLIEQCEQLFAEAEAQGLGGLDMIGVVGALEQFTSARRMVPSLSHALVPATEEGSGLEPGPWSHIQDHGPTWSPGYGRGGWNGIRPVRRKASAAVRS